MHAPQHILHTTSNVPLRHKFLGRWSLLVAVLASHALPLSLPQPILGQKGWKSLGAKSVEYGRWANTSNFKSWLSLTVWLAAWGWASSCHRHARIQHTPFSFITGLHWFWNISLFFWRTFYNFCGFHLNDLCIFLLHIGFVIACHVTSRAQLLQ